MNSIGRILVVVALATIVLAQSPEIPLTDSRLTIHTLVREDIFAGFLQGDMEKFSRGEKNIQLLLDLRPQEKPDLLAWKGGAHLIGPFALLRKSGKMSSRKTMNSHSPGSMRLASFSLKAEE